MDRRRATSPPPDLSDELLYQQGPPTADEMNLADIWVAVMRRKLIVGVLAVGSSAIGLLYAFFAPPIYEYTTIIEVGTRYLGGRIELVESLETARVKLADGYIAQTLREHVTESKDAKRYEVKVEVPKNSQVLILTSKGTAENESTYVTLHEAIVGRLRADNLRVQEAIRKDLEARLELQQRSLAELRQQSRFFDAQLRRLEGHGEMPVNELSYLTTLRLADNQRAQAEIVSLIDSARLQLANMRETQALVSPMRSIDPIGASKGVVIVFSAIVGLVIGILVALFFEFTRKVRLRADRVNSGGMS